MSDSSEQDTDETQTEGAIQANVENYYFDLEQLYEDELVNIGGDYSTASGPVVEGERIQVGLVHKPEGTGSKLHSHPNEQFYYVVQGTLQVKVEDNDPVDVEVGQAAYVPPETEHWSVAAPGEDVFFFVVKDMRHKIYGTAVEEEGDAQYMEGYEPEE
jgi:mannose-6-phosphate isomerase-like protein (cupin superfamily)